LNSFTIYSDRHATNPCCSNRSQITP